ncbi:MAG: HlyD family secretion protein, partial [Planctomycetota bacterium]
TLGQSLFETGPLKQMLAELWVDGADVARIQPDQKVTLRLEADPHRVIRGTVSRVGPRAEIRDGQSVFIAWVTLENEEGRMRPGMVGRAKVSTQRAPCLWSLLRKPVHAIATTWWL